MLEVANGIYKPIIASNNYQKNIMKTLNNFGLLFLALASAEENAEVGSVEATFSMSSKC